ncbi:tonB-system energizer ExbB [Methylobacterium sp. 4-46]|uniref:tonB-system energizer ExbB n=1 Tax=unclassified Methylobacterium TaxID=2615210 RepID=UPI000165C815|nr:MULTISPECIES: tonB-system energizer ExbB [Methylobacterium]ACA15658.1 tonB-system energizer ExbB [Methylobacterium sp. 4-46]WFT81370.1 tonB-system energizer ExbB [Methylobacterium nodulans]
MRGRDPRERAAPRRRRASAAFRAGLGAWLILALLGLAGAPGRAQPQGAAAPPDAAAPAPAAAPASVAAPASAAAPASVAAPASAAPAEAPPAAAEPARAPQADRAEPAARPAAAAPQIHDLSPWAMFLNADILVKIVMSGLALASVVTWTILAAKTVELGLARRGLGRALGRVAGAGSLAEAERELGGRDTVLDRLVAAILDEVRISRGLGEGIKERAASRCAEIVKAEGRTARRGMGALATIGAISPFVGLFGTVWGIMNSFIGIARAQTTNLAVVAPGIAEALLATAIGLAAAIPAVIVYNHFARATRGYGELVQRASGAAQRLLSRDLDRDGEAGRRLSLARAAE